MAESKIDVPLTLYKIVKRRNKIIPYNWVLRFRLLNSAGLVAVLRSLGRLLNCAGSLHWKPLKKMKNLLINLPTRPEAYNYAYEEAMKRITGYDPDFAELAHYFLRAWSNRYMKSLKLFPNYAHGLSNQEKSPVLLQTLYHFRHHPIILQYRLTSIS